MQEPESDLEPTRFSEAVETGEIVETSGYHQPNGRGVPRGGTDFQQCGCSLTTEKGAYRDVTVKMPDGRLIHYYHQSPVVVEKNGRFRLDNNGYETATTKERINRHSPVRLFQRDFEWFVGPRDDPEPFENGMVVEK